MIEGVVAIVAAVVMFLLGRRAGQNEVWAEVDAEVGRILAEREGRP